MSESIDRRFATWSVGIITVGALAMVSSTILLRESVIRLEGRVGAMEAQISAAANDRYRGEDAKRDFAAASERFAVLKERVDAIENKQRDALVRLGQLEFQVGIKKPGS